MASVRRVGVVSHASWERACAALGIATSRIPLPTNDASRLFHTTLQQRLAAGSRIFEQLSGESVDCLLDTCGGGLTFVEGSGGLSDLKLTHERANTPLVSHCLEPLPALFQGMDPAVMWQVLGSRSWIKAVADRDHAAELRAFGVPAVIYLAACAFEYDYEAISTPPDDSAVDVSFVGDAVGNIDESSIEDWIREAARGFLAESKSLPFRGLFQSFVNDRNLPATTSRSDFVARASNYYRSKQQFLHIVATHGRDAMIRAAARQIGQRLTIVGKGWNLGDGRCSVRSFTSSEAMFRHFRTIPIHIEFAEPSSERAVSPNAFIITACGGFLLAHRRPELDSYFTPGVEIETFATEKELIEKIEYYVANPKLRMELAERGRARTLREHLARHRLAEVLRYVDSLNEAHMASSHPDAVSKPPTTCEEFVVASHPRETVEQSNASIVKPWIQTTQARDDKPAILFLLNGGDFTRHYLIGMMSAASSMGIPTVSLELDPVWDEIKSGRRSQGTEIAALVKERRVQLVVGSSLNGSWEWPVQLDADNRIVSFFERLGIPHLMWWTDHPHWANEKIGLRDDLQPVLQSPNHHHFVKSELAADELRELLGWSNCYGLPVAENPELLQPAPGVTPSFDIVAIVGSQPKLPEALVRFVDQKCPAYPEIINALLPEVDRKLPVVWDDAPRGLFNELNELGRQWIRQRAAEPRVGSYRHFLRLKSEFPNATAWIRTNPRNYFRAAEVLWDLGHWQRAFVLMHLAKRFRVGVFGSDWSSVGLGNAGRVNYSAHPRTYAQGRVAININQGNDEEGLSHKPFQMAACGVPMVHNDVQGLEACFEPEREVAVFSTPTQAVEKVQELLDSPDKRTSFAHAARERLCRDHSWNVRFRRMLEISRFSSIFQSCVPTPNRSLALPALISQQQSLR